MLDVLSLETGADAAHRELLPAHVRSMTAALRTPARLIVLRGFPENFSAGLSLDLAANHPDRAVDCARAVVELVLALKSAPAPVVAIVDGAAVGGGVALAAAADLVLATPRSHFSLPEVVTGLIPGMALPLLASRTGLGRATRMALLASPLPAAEALAAGLVDEVTPDPEARLAHHQKRWRRMDAEALRALKSWAFALGDLRASLDEGVHRLELQLKRPETRKRLQRLLHGETPWDEEELA